MIATLIITIGWGILSVGFSLFTTRRLITPCTFYWTGWVLGMIGLLFAVEQEVLPELDDYAQGLILRLHFGALLGYGLGVLAWCVHVYRVSQQLPLRRPPAAYYVPRFLWIWFYATVGYGVVMLAYRIVEAGGSLNVSEIRETYMFETYMSSDVPFWLRLRGYLMLVPYLIAVIQGLRDGTDGKLQWKGILGIWLLGIPGGLAIGGRDWILGILPVYVVSFLLVRPGTVVSRNALRLGAMVMGCFLGYPSSSALWGSSAIRMCTGRIIQWGGVGAASDCQLSRRADRRDQRVHQVFHDRAPANGIAHVRLPGPAR